MSQIISVGVVLQEASTNAKAPGLTSHTRAPSAIRATVFSISIQANDLCGTLSLDLESSPGTSWLGEACMLLHSLRASPKGTAPRSLERCSECRASKETHNVAR